MSDGRQANQVAAGGPGFRVAFFRGGVVRGRSNVVVRGTGADGPGEPGDAIEPVRAVGGNTDRRERGELRCRPDPMLSGTA